MLTLSRWKVGGICLLGPIGYVVVIELVKVFDRGSGRAHPAVATAEP